MEGKAGMRHSPYDNTDLDKMIRKGCSNQEIRATLGPISKDRMSTRRCRLNCRVQQKVRNDCQGPPLRERDYAKEVREGLESIRRTKFSFFSPEEFRGFLKTDNGQIYLSEMQG
jgi:hypothetical protein